jgi:hypothetical protein
MEQNENSDNNYFLLLYQSEFNNLSSNNKELTSEIFKSLIQKMELDQTVLKNGEYMDLFLSENLLSTLLPGLESLSKNVEKLIHYSDKENEQEVNRFNPCNFLAEFLMRNNPKYGKNKQTHQNFLIYTRKERKNRMMKKSGDELNSKIREYYKKNKTKLMKTNILSFVEKVDTFLNLKNTLKRYNWIEHFRVYKDDQEITFDEFLVAFKNAILEIYEINEEMLKQLLN